LQKNNAKFGQWDAQRHCRESRRNAYMRCLAQTARSLILPVCVSVRRYLQQEKQRSQRQPNRQPFGETAPP
jgi:hypothetical protein